MAKFQTKGLAGRIITVQPSHLNNGLITITIKSKNGQVFEPISLEVSDAAALAGAIEAESEAVHSMVAAV